MSENESVNQTANLLRGIMRSIDKRLDYNLVDPMHEGRLSLRLVTRGREGVVSIRTTDLRMAVVDDVLKNAIRQKIKSARDHLLSNYVVDVMGRKITRLLKQSASTREDTKSSFFYRPQRGRR